MSIPRQLISSQAIDLDRLNVHDRDSKKIKEYYLFRTTLNNCSRSFSFRRERLYYMQFQDLRRTSDILNIDTFSKTPECHIQDR
jgi:hypothetical protein